MEKVLQSVEENETKDEAMKEQCEEAVGGDDNAEEEENEEERDDGDNDNSDETEMVEDTKTQATRNQLKGPPPARTKDKTQAGVLNLNNEVVKMRKEVKRVRVLIIRKLIRHINSLKKKKGSEAQVEKSQRKAARMVEEIHAMKGLVPDVVTKTALQKTLNFEQLCKNPKSTVNERATARIATHPQFNKKIEDIKAAVEAFKEERLKGGKQGGKEKLPNKAEKVQPQSQDKGKKREIDKKTDREEKVNTAQLKIVSENKIEDSIQKDLSAKKPGADSGKTDDPSNTSDVHSKDVTESKSVRPTTTSTKSSKAKDPVTHNPQGNAAAKKPVFLEQEEEEESDLESSDEEEKEYFDDSTEERFRKQSSMSEESDDDFFVGKVTKFKKKKRQKDKEEESKGEKDQEVTEDSTDKVTPSNKVQSELDKLESRLKSKSPSLQSVFCSSLTGARKSAGGGTAGRRGGNIFRGHRGGASGFDRDSGKQSKFQKHITGTDRNSGSKYIKPESGRHESKEKGFSSAGRGRGRGDFTRQRGGMGRGGFSQQAPQQTLHPSWEASKKRKEQQGQILAFQGKKIKFDDDD